MDTHTHSIDLNEVDSENPKSPPALPQLGSMTNAAQKKPTQEPPKPLIPSELYPRILRWIGAGILGLAALSFMVSGWVSGTPLLRTGSFLGFTALLSGAGIFCAYRWSEDKGARTFLALAAAFIPANFAQLGALIFAEKYGSIGYDVGLKKVFTFPAVGETALILSCLISLAVLVPIAFTGFSALARAGAKKMTLLFLASNAFILLPVRDANLVALLGMGIVTALVIADRRWFAKETALRTWDGIAMRSLLFAPVMLMVIRNVVMHPMTAGLMSFITGLLALVCFMGIPRAVKREGFKITSQFFGYALGLVAWLFAILEFIPKHWLWDEAILPVIFLPWCLAVFGLSFVSIGKGVAARGMSSIVALVLCIVNLEYFGDIGYLPSVLCLLVAILMLMTAFLLEERVVLCCGAVLLFVGLGYHIHYALTFAKQNLWLSLAAAGTTVILASSYLERNSVNLRRRAIQLRRHWQAWH